MKRGDIYSVVLPSEYGKPRPAVIVQANHWNDKLTGCIICPITSYPPETAIRIMIPPNASNGLMQRSFIMTDKISTVSMSKIGVRIGTIDAALLQQLNLHLMSLLGLNDSKQ